MRHNIITITCDICNPDAILHPLPGAPEWRGVFDGPWDAAEDVGWRLRGKNHICPDCFEERAYKFIEIIRSGGKDESKAKKIIEEP